MLLLPGDLVYDLVAIVLTLITGVILYYKWIFGYWRRKGLQYIEPSIPFGNAKKLFTAKASFGEQFREYYDHFRALGVKHGGAFVLARPFYVPVDPVLVKHIIQKDFQHFVNRGFYVDERLDPLSGHLLALEDEKWKNLRVKLTSTFTSGKMKMMFETLVSCADGIDTVLEESILKREPLDIKDVLARFTTDNISSCAFGLEVSSLKNPDADFRKYGKRIFENTSWENVKNLAQFAFPRQLLSILKYKNTKPDVEHFMLNTIAKTVEYREKNNIYRKDFLHLLLQLKNRGEITNDEKITDSLNGTNKKGTLTMNEFAAQCYIFFIGGFETSATTMTFTLYELAKHPEIQDKLRDEITRVLQKHQGVLSYEAIMEMTYMDQVIYENFRKNPPVPFLNRQCTIPYDVPGSSLRLDKGTMVVIPVVGIHNDPEYYPNPDKFDPERFSGENKAKTPGLTWMPFGEGPRVCIGLRFGMLQSKVGLTAVLRNHRVSLNKKTKEPLVMDKTSVITTSDTGVWLNVTKLNGVRKI